MLICVQCESKNLSLQGFVNFFSQRLRILEKNFTCHSCFRGAEPPANSDHRLVVATAALQPYRAMHQKIFQAPAPLYIVDAELRPCRQI